jgi:hypothetical protein
MGASDSKLVFKQGIFRLSDPKVIPIEDAYWKAVSRLAPTRLWFLTRAQFWELPESAEDIFTLFSPADVRRTRDNCLANLETLILSTISKLIELRNAPSFPNPDQAPERQALNCIRVLTRVLPFVYEAANLEQWEENLFWTPRKTKTTARRAREVIFDNNDQTPLAEPEEQYEEKKPLGEELLDALIDLAFFSEFTLPKTAPGKSKVTYGIWQTGVGYRTPIISTKEFENNRREILRLLLVMFGKAMYLPSGILPVKGVYAITYLTTCSDKQIVMSLLCSLLNTTVKYNPATWRVPYDHVMFRDDKQLLVIYCLQLLLVLVSYPVPETTHGVVQKNYFRHFLGRLHRPQDFQFLVDGMTRILNQQVLKES